MKRSSQRSQGSQTEAKALKSAWGRTVDRVLDFLSGLLNSGEGRLSPEELKAMLAGKGRVILIDVRSAAERKSGHIAGSSHVPLEALAKRPIPASGKIVVYCATGARSRRARKMLLDRGLKEVFDLKGGIGAWVRAGGFVKK